MEREYKSRSIPCKNNLWITSERKGKNPESFLVLEPSLCSRRLQKRRKTRPNGVGKAKRKQNARLCVCAWVNMYFPFPSPVGVERHQGLVILWDVGVVDASFLLFLRSLGTLVHAPLLTNDGKRLRRRGSHVTGALAQERTRMGRKCEGGYRRKPS